MSNVKISNAPVPFALPAAAAINGTETLPMDQTVGGVVTTVSSLFSALMGSISVTYPTGLVSIGAGLTVTGTTTIGVTNASGLVSANLGLTVAGGNFTSRGILDQGTANALTINSVGTVSVATPATAVAAMTIQGSALTATTALTINVTNASTDALTLNGVTGTIGPDIAFDLGGVFKAGIGVSSKTGEGITGVATGTLWLRNQSVGTGIALSANSGTNAHMTMDTNGRIIVNPSGAGTSIGFQVQQFSSNEVGISILDPGVNATQLRLSTTNTNISIQSAGGNADLNFNQGAALAFQVPNTGAVGVRPGTVNGELLRAITALTTGAGAAAGTLTNAPSAGNPTKWIKINDAGTIRSIPAW